MHQPRHITIDLQSGNAQSPDAVGFDRSLPGDEFLGRELITPARLLETDPPIAHCANDRGFASWGPTSGVCRRQVGGSARFPVDGNFAWTVRHLAELEAPIARLTGRGARAIVVAGMSVGGLAALAFGARRSGLAGIIALAPNGSPERLVQFFPPIAESVAQARAMVVAGRGDERASFIDMKIRGSHQDHANGLRRDRRGHADDHCECHQPRQQSAHDGSL
jgi:hypothetical protein